MIAIEVDYRGVKMPLEAQWLHSKMRKSQWPGFWRESRLKMAEKLLSMDKPIRRKYWIKHTRYGRKASNE